MGRSWKNRLKARVMPNPKSKESVMLISWFGIRLFCTLLLLLPVSANAGRFVPGANCVDGPKTCIDRGEKVIDGFKVTRDCWQWVYTKTCNYPSKNNCGDYAHCYAIADLPCLLYDSIGNCVNMQKEFNCKAWEMVTMDEEALKNDLSTKEGKAKLICTGAPCFDGNCFDKSYETDVDIMDSISKLTAVSSMKGATDENFKVFGGTTENCTKKITDYTNCCSTSVKGWGKLLGAGCSLGEKALMEKRRSNLCVYVGKKSNKTLGITTSVKHYFCCFGNILDKIIQVEGRKQLGISFGSGGNPDCRGLTLNEILKLDFDRMDFGEFYVEIVKKMKLPNVGDVEARVKGSGIYEGHNVKQYDGNEQDKANNMTGVNTKVKHE